MAYIKISEAAQKARTEVNYLHKLIKKGELDARSESKGKLKYWYINENCHRFQRLLDRLGDSAHLEEQPGPTLADIDQVLATHDKKPAAPRPIRSRGGHTLDWLEWESMAKRGEEIVHRRFSERTTGNYKDYINRFFRDYHTLNRDTLRQAMAAYEVKETRERDYYSAKSHLYFALMTVAKYFAFKGYESADLIKTLEPLRPQKKHTVVTRRCYTEETVQSAVTKVQTVKTKRNAPAYSEYNAALNTALIHTAFFTGARSSEICGIRLQDIDWKAGSIRLYGKGGKERFVGIPEELKQSIKAYLRHRPASPSDALFLGDTGTPMKAPYLHRRIKRAGRWIDTPQLAPHAIRRTSITWMLNVKKLPMAIVRDAVGHSSLAVTNIYTKPTANDVIDQMRQL